MGGNAAASKGQSASEGVPVGTKLEDFQGPYDDYVAAEIDNNEYSS
jgi:hypothetical protein